MLLQSVLFCGQWSKDLFAFTLIFHYWTFTFSSQPLPRCSNRQFCLWKYSTVQDKTVIFVADGVESPISTFICLNCTILHFTLTWSQLGLDLVVSAGSHSDLVLIKEAVLLETCIWFRSWSLQLSFFLSLSTRVKTVLQLPVTHLPPAPEEENRRSRRKWAGRR